MRGIKLLGLIFIFCMSSCTFRISVKPGTFDGLETFSVQYFPNRARIVETSLSQRFTDALIDKIESESPLRQVNGMGHANFEGEIKGYDTKPVNISGNETASQNRLTISIRVKYTNETDPDLSFDKTFSRYEDYDSGQSLDAVADELIEEIIPLILEDIYNAAFVTW